MKKLHIFLSFLFTSVLFTIALVTSSYAYTEVHDQYQTEGSGCLTAYSGYNHNQTFLPQKNVLTQIQVKLRYMNGGNLTLTVKDNITGQIVVQKTQRMGVGEDWDTFYFTGDGLGYILDTSHQHSIWIGTDYYAGGEAPCWLYSSSNLYLDGTRRIGLTNKTGDFTFKTYGYDIDMGRDNPEPPPAPEDPEEEAQTEEATPEEEETGTGIIPDTPQDKEDIEVVEESTEVSEPVLDSVIINSAIEELEEGTITIQGEDTVKITGTADAGDTVSVFINESAYTAIADEDGNWYVVFTVADLEDGTYEIEAQATKDELGSKIVSLCSLIIETEETISTEVIAEEEETTIWFDLTQGDLRWVTVASALTLLGIFLIIFIIIYKRKKKEEKKPIPEKEV